MNIVDALLGEHGVLKHQIEALRLAAPQLSDIQLRAAVFHLAEAVESHAAIEDELLFTPLDEGDRVPAGPVAAMRHEHRTIEDLASQLLHPAATSGPAAPPLRVVLRLLDTLLHHFAHEEHVLFPMARTVVDRETLEELGRRWAGRRAVELAPAGAPRR
jgi:hemerythrin-like domain-containing protein